MGVLTKREIVSRITNGEIVVSPILDAKQIGTASVDLRLGTTALLVRGSDLSHVDPKAYASAEHKGPYDLEQRRRRKLERVSVPFDSQLMLHAGGVVLVSTLEWVRLPKDLSGVVTARSSWAREGLSIATATFINPCYNGIITLELSNLGQIPIALYPGLRLAQLAFYAMDAEMAEDCGTNRSQFDLSFEPGAGRLTAGDEPFIRKYEDE